MQQLKEAIYAGFFSASGSVFGKCMGLSFDGYTYVWIPRLICLVLMLFCNTMNMRYFVKSLQAVNDTLTAAVMSSGSNYFFSFAFGILMFSETISFVSVIGIMFILCGLHFLCDGSKSKVS